MSNNRSTLVVVTNLYPVPWGPNRASFNKQQFELIAQQQAVKIVVLLPWTEWLKYYAQCQSTNDLIYCPFFYFPKIGRRLVPYFQLFSLLFCVPWLKKQQATAIMTSWGFPDAVAVSMLNTFLNLPFFVKVHGTDVNENTKFSARRRMMKKWLNKAKTIFCASNALAQSLSKIGIKTDKLLVNYNGVNSKIFFPANTPPSLQKFVYVGSLIDAKGVNELLSAFIIALKKFPKIELDILGEGPLKKALTAKIAEHKLAKNVRLHGSVPLNRVAEYIRNATVLVLPSYREGVPNVLLESFASGTPVIATNVGGIPEVVNEQVGILIEPKNVTQLVTAIEKSLTMVWSAEVIIAHASQFNWHKNVQCVLEQIGNK